MMSRYLVYPFLLVLLVSVVLAAPENDIDEDGILNERDVCPDTPRGDVIVDPSQHLAYAGCSCEQIKALVDTTNPCISFFCYEEVLDIREKNYQGSLVDCPEDYCDGLTLYDYPDDGRDTCRNAQLVPYTCDPVVTERAVICGYEPSDTPLPVLEGDVQTYTLTEATFSHTLPEPAFQGDDQVLQALFVLDFEGYKTLDIELYLDDELINATEKYCGEDTVLFCTATWDLDASVIGEHEYEMRVSYDAGAPITEIISVPFIVRRRPFTPEVAEKPVVGVNGTAKESFLLGLIFDELNANNLYTDEQAFMALVEESADYLFIKTDKSYDEQNNITTYNLSASLIEGVVGDLTLIEYIPKEVVESASDITFSVEPTIVLRDDPLIMWHFSAVDERVNISYEVSGEQQVTGNTVAVVENLENETSVWFIVLPMLLIPLLVILLIVVPRMIHHKD